MKVIKKKLKIAFFLDHKLQHYRVSLFEELAEIYEVTVFHRGPELTGDFHFKQKTSIYKKMFKFEFIMKIPYKEYDMFIFMQNMRILNILD